MNRCDFCGAPLDTEEKKCPYCGTPLPKPEKRTETPHPVSPQPPAPPPVWNGSAYAPPPVHRAKKRTPGCLIAFVIVAILLVFSFAAQVFEEMSDDPWEDDAFSQISAELPPDDLPEEYRDWYQPGMYKVGVDLAPGVYRAEATEGDGYYAVFSDSSGKTESILFNDLFETYSYFLLREGQYVRLSRCVALESEKVPAAQPKNGIFTDGTFRVGIDIPAGEYKLTGSGDDSYYRLMGSANCAFADEQYIASDYIENSVYLTLEDGQFLTLESGAQLTVETALPQA